MVAKIKVAVVCQLNCPGFMSVVISNPANTSGRRKIMQPVALLRREIVETFQ